MQIILILSDQTMYLQGIQFLLLNSTIHKTAEFERTAERQRLKLKIYLNDSRVKCGLSW